MAVVQYIVFNSSGTAIGFGSTSDGTMIPNSVVCNSAQYANWNLCTLVNGVIIQLNTPALTMIQQAQNALNAGLTISSTENTGLNGTYPCDNNSYQNMQLISNFVNTYNEFPTGSTLTLPDINGSPHVFNTVGEFVAFFNQLSKYYTLLSLIANGLSTVTSLPSNSVAIP